MSKHTKHVAVWAVIFVVTFSLALILYCFSLFRELEALMAQKVAIQPTVVYSDSHILSMGDNFIEAFVPDRLRELKITFDETPGKLSWQNQDFNVPELLLPKDSPLRESLGNSIVVTYKNELIDSIAVNGKSVNSILIPPTPLAQLAQSHQVRHYLKLDKIPTNLLQAIIAIEDQRFLEHIGFDLRSLLRAVWVNIRSRTLSQGGSTLTQQLVKNLLGTRQKTFFRKARELVLAILVEVRYSKEEILEKYLNEVYFGQVGSLEIHGVSEAAGYFFHKPVSRLSLAEMATMAGIIRGPVVYSPYKHLDRALERKNTVLKKMAELKIITPEELVAGQNERISFASQSIGANKAPYFVDYVKAQILDQLGERISADDLNTAGLRIFTTLDIALQRRADRAVMSSVGELEARYKIQRPLRLEGLLVASDPQSGFVRAIVGGRSYGDTTFNRVLNMKRQVGSTFKPIVYLAALMKGRDSHGVPFSPAYMVDDEPWTYKFGKTTWSPKNYEKAFRGHITLREAFANSVNIPMAKIGTDIGLDWVISSAERLGIKEKLPEVPSLVLGSVELGAIDLLQAYSTIANRGERVSLVTITVIEDGNGHLVAHNLAHRERVFDPPVMDLLGDLMRSVVTEGTAKALSSFGYKKSARGKTGTTSFYRDAWFAGFSQGLAAVTWVGFDELKVPDEADEIAIRKFKSPAQLTGAGAALPPWARFFLAAKPSHLAQSELALDPSLQRQKIDKTSGGLAKTSCPMEFVVDEIFLPHTAPETECNRH